MGKTTTYIITEIEHKTGNHGPIRELVLPHRLEPGGYHALTSIEAFRNGTRKGVSPEDKAARRITCCWGPKCLYLVKTLEEWKEDAARTTEAMRKAIPNYPDPREQPRSVITSLKEFYDTIGFDTESRCYRNEKGEEIKFTTIPSQKSPAKPLAAGPEME